MLQWIVEKALSYKQREERSSFPALCWIITFTGQSHLLYLLLKSRILCIPSSILYLSTQFPTAFLWLPYSVVNYSIPGRVFIDIKEVNRLVREAFVCVCVWEQCVCVGVNVFNHTCMRACVHALICTVFFHLCVHVIVCFLYLTLVW